MARLGGLAATGALPSGRPPVRLRLPCSRETTTASHTAENATPSRFSASGPHPRLLSNRRNGSAAIGYPGLGKSRHQDRPGATPTHPRATLPVGANDFAAIGQGIRAIPPQRNSPHPQGIDRFATESAEAYPDRESVACRLSIRFSRRLPSPKKVLPRLCRTSVLRLPPFSVPVGQYPLRYSPPKPPPYDGTIASHRENPVPTPHFHGSSAVRAGSPLRGISGIAWPR